MKNDEPNPNDSSKDDDSKRSDKPDGGHSPHDELSVAECAMAALAEERELRADELEAVQNQAAAAYTALENKLALENEKLESEQEMVRTLREMLKQANDNIRTLSLPPSNIKRTLLIGTFYLMMSFAGGFFGNIYARHQDDRRSQAQHESEESPQNDPFAALKKAGAP